MRESGFISEVLFLGNSVSTQDSGRLSKRFYLPTNDLSNHIFLTGGEKSDISIFGKVAIEELAEKNIPSIIIDLDGTLSSVGLLFDSPTLKYLDLWKKLESDPKKSRDLAQKGFTQHLKQITSYGFTDEHIRRIKKCSETVVFTPRNGKGVPLATSSLINPPANFSQIYLDDPQLAASIVDSLVESLIQRLYLKQASSHEKEKKFLAELLVYAWLNDINVEGLTGLVRLIELTDDPPIGDVEGVSLDDHISVSERADLTQRLYNFSVVEKQLWYKGIPLDVDLLRGDKFESDKTRISVINLSELESSSERTFVVSRILYSIYNWMKKNQPSNVPRLCVYLNCLGGIDSMYSFDPASHVTKSPINLLLKEGNEYGVCCILSTQKFDNVDYKGLAQCKTWIVGGFEKNESADKLLEGIALAEIDSERMDTLINSCGENEVAAKLCSGEMLNVRQKCLASFHCVLPISFLSRVTDQNLREDFKPFYLSGTTSGAEVLAKLKASDLTPQVIFQNFEFGSDNREPFILEVEPEEAIMICLRELAEEEIFVDEVEFKNCQLTVVRAHKANWKIDALIRSPLGRIMEHIKDAGIYSRFDSFKPLNDEEEEKVVQLLDNHFIKHYSEICKRIAVLFPEPKIFTNRQVRINVGRQINAPAKDIQVAMREQNVATVWRFTVEYKSRLIECNIDMINRSVRMNFPAFSPLDALEAVKKIHPDFKIKEEDVISRAFSYMVNYTSGDRDYLFKVNRRSCKISKTKASITESKAREIASSKTKEESFMVRKYRNAWNFYYPNGVRLIIDEKNGNAVFRDMISADEAEALAIDALSRRAGESHFLIEKKEFKEGKWSLRLSSKRWNVELEINEDGKVFSKLKLRREHCLSEARRILTQQNISAAMYKNSDVWSDGWTFDFLSSLGDFTINIGPESAEFIKKRLTPEGIRHFVELETGGKVIGINDKRIFWSVLFKKDDLTYDAQMDKQSGDIKCVKVKGIFFWRSINIKKLKRKR
ncbi:MAG: hypothetical protein GY858_09975 [Candidatus Omnitrophica bacterium]|nr:hypothetical protein [Candidatus Omnitrophota bacterium]